MKNSTAVVLIAFAVLYACTPETLAPGDIGYFGPKKKISSYDTTLSFGDTLKYIVNNDSDNTIRLYKAYIGIIDSICYKHDTVWIIEGILLAYTQINGQLEMAYKQNNINKANNTYQCFLENNDYAEMVIWQSKLDSQKNNTNSNGRGFDSLVFTASEGLISFNLKNDKYERLN